MYLLDNNCTDRMERETAQRKTVYRISLTLVKRESVDDGTQQADTSTKVEMQRSGLLEQLEEVEDECEDLSASHSYRSIRTCSMGQLELGHLKVSRNLRIKATSPLAENGKASPSQNPERPAQTAGAVENGSTSKKRLLKAKSMEERSTAPPLNGDGNMLPSKMKAAPETPPLKRPPAFLRRSFSFRHWTGSELLRLRTLSKDKHHNSSGCISHGTGQDGGEKDREDPPREKSRTLEVGAILNKTNSMSELNWWERARGGKNRTLDNSDLLRMSAENDGSGGGFFLRGTGGRSSERRLRRFFSGIFSRRDEATTSTPVGSPSSSRCHQSKRKESMNGGSTDGKGSLHISALLRMIHTLAGYDFCSSCSH